MFFSLSPRWFLVPWKISPKKWPSWSSFQRLNKKNNEKWWGCFNDLYRFKRLCLVSCHLKDRPSWNDMPPRIFSDGRICKEITNQIQAWWKISRYTSVYVDICRYVSQSLPKGLLSRWFWIPFRWDRLPSLKLRVSLPLKIDGRKTNLFFCDAIFSGGISFNVGKEAIIPKPDPSERKQ